MIQLTDNLEINKPAPVDDRLGVFESTAEALVYINEDRRYIGLTIIVDNGTGAHEYWFKDGVTDSDLIVKSEGGGTTWGTITGTLSNQTDLQTALNAKANTSSLATVATSGSYNDLINKPTIPNAQVNSDWNSNSGVSQILNKPTIPSAQVNSDWNAVSGVAQILNKPTIPNAQVNSDWNATSGVAQILNKPTIPTSLPPNGSAGGDLTGTYPNPTVHKVHGVDFQSGTPQAGDVWIYGGSPANWQHQALTSSDLPNSIDATKIANGNVSNAEFQHLDGVTSAIQTQLDAKAPIASPTFTGTVGGITKSMVGLGNVDNTSDANKPISTATQTALNNRSYAVGTSGSASITIVTGGVANLIAISGHTFTIPEADFPIGATIQINGMSERVSGAGSANGGLSVDINGSKRYWILTGTGTQWQYQFTLYRESATSIRMMGGGSAQIQQGSFGSINTTSTTATVTAGGNVVCALSGWGTTAGDVIAYRFFKAILTR